MATGADGKVTALDAATGEVAWRAAVPGHPSPSFQSYGDGLAYAGVQTLASVAPDGLPRAQEITIDPRVVLFTLAISVVAGLLFGLLPVIKFARPQLANALKEGGRLSSAGKSRHRARNTLVVVEIALAVILLITGQLRWQSTIERSYAVAAGEAGIDPQAIDDGRSAILDAFVTADEYPALRRAVDAGVFATGEDPFAFGLERVLDGVADYLAKRATGERPASPPSDRDAPEVAADKRVREARKAVREAEKRLRDARRVVRVNVDQDHRDRVDRHAEPGENRRCPVT